MILIDNDTGGFIMNAIVGNNHDRMLGKDLIHDRKGAGSPYYY